MRTTAILMLMFSYLPVQAAVVPVVNPGFESGTLAGWSLSGTDSSPQDEGIYYGVDAEDAHTGSFGAYFGPVGGTLTLSQNLATAAGTSYTITFWLAETGSDSGAPYVTTFSASLGGVPGTISPAVTFSSNYQQYSFTEVATATFSPLAFTFRDDTGFFSLDDISVSAGTGTVVPEPRSANLVFIVFFGILFLLGWERLSSYKKA